MSHPECNWFRQFESARDERSVQEIVLEQNEDKTFIDAAGLGYVEIVSEDAVAPIYVVACPDFLPQLEADWLIVQPDVIRKNPFKGWEPVPRLVTFLGSDELTVIQFKPTDDPDTLCAITTEGERGFEVQSFTDRGALKLVRVSSLRNGPEFGVSS